ncbi:hypothetical protein [Botrimarina mediterranea]|uniref:Uncharacterized protein n=1 Tax=Botrimarina mediterranea TaxID=2528022 RepID=A0A518K775_9BACT|nr:hypothetical protein [Botrimarina mediterranea]QDV73662.1 hypothetical protein Spa11_18610 [Botrimarina mediterranea]QDV78252.1 hypothetical protein K2D_18590 [Planctomycetes bacterium K2D]
MTIRVLVSLGLLGLLAMALYGAALTKDTPALPVEAESVATAEAKVFERGLLWRKEVERDEKAMRLSLDRLDKAIALIADDNLNGERLTIVELRAVVRQMQRRTPEVAAAHKEARADTLRYGETLCEAAPVLSAAAKRFEDYAADEPYEELRDDYRLWSESFRAIAEKYLQQETLVGPTVETITDNLDFVERVDTQLKRVEALLEIVPEESAETEEFLSRLAAYVRSFADFRERLRSLHGRTTGQRLEQEAEQPAVKITVTSLKADARQKTFAQDKPLLLPQSLSALSNVPAVRREAWSPIPTPDISFTSERAKPEPRVNPRKAEARATTQRRAERFAGVWAAPDSNFEIVLERSGDDLLASIGRRGVVTEVSGRLRQRGEADSFVAERLVYTFASGESVDLAGTVLTFTDDGHASVTGVRYGFATRSDKVVRLGLQNYELRRVR